MYQGNGKGTALHHQKNEQKGKAVSKTSCLKIKRKYTDPDRKSWDACLDYYRNSACIKSKMLTNVCNVCTDVLFGDAVPR